MPYNMWFVTTAEQTRPAEEWINCVAEFRNDLRTELVTGTSEDWQEVTIKGPDDWWWLNFTRRLVPAGGDTGGGDLEFFRSWLAVGQPEVNARWVEEYLTRVRTVYKFECSTSAPEDNMDAVDHLVRSLRDGSGGLLYAELEGWKNPLGGHITWEFSEGVTGVCPMALRRPGGWAYFRMELGAAEHREAFKAGVIPAGVEAREFRD